MDVEKLLRDLETFLRSVSEDYGSGSLTNDLITVILVFTFFTIALLFLAMRRGRRMAMHESAPGADRGVAVSGKIEKLEMNVNDLRTEVVRSLEIIKGDMNYLRDELSEIRSLLSGGTESGGSGGGGGGASFDIEGGGGSDSGGGGTLFSDREAAAPETAPEEEDTERFLADELVAETTKSQAPVEVVAEIPATLATRLTKTRSGLFQRLRGLFVGKPTLDADTIDELEALLVSSDLGVKMSSRLIAQLREGLQSGDAVTQEKLVERLRAMILEILLRAGESLSDSAPRKESDGPHVVMVVGVNGVGKTTTVAKLANRWREQGASVMVAAADTFRAAAVDQLAEWGKLVGVPVISGAPDAKPATVVYDAMVAARAQEVDILLVDTAGRLHTKSNLMQELEGVRNAMTRHQSSAPHETVLVVDGATGQNAIMQAREFNAAVTLTGLIVTKLDGTPKGGVVVAISDELGIPVQYIGVGESAADLRPFKAAEFTDALLDASGLDGGDDAQPSVSAHGAVRRRRRGEDSGTTLMMV